jgi:hypothetical protein
LVGCPCTVTAQWIMYRSLFSCTFGAHCQCVDVAIALIRWICQSATSFPACLTTARDNFGVDHFLDKINVVFQTHAFSTTTLTGFVFCMVRFISEDANYFCQ